jgi:hypothetical protein
MIRAPRYRATLADPYRDHLRARRAADPAVPVQQLPAEIREQGYPGSMNLPDRYITPGRSRPAAPITPARRPDAAHPARHPQRQPAGTARQNSPSPAPR